MAKKTTPKKLASKVNRFPGWTDAKLQQEIATAAAPPVPGTPVRRDAVNWLATLRAEAARRNLLAAKNNAKADKINAKVVTMLRKVSEALDDAHLIEEDAESELVAAQNAMAEAADLCNDAKYRMKNSQRDFIKAQIIREKAMVMEQRALALAGLA